MEEEEVDHDDISQGFEGGHEYEEEEIEFEEDGHESDEA